MRCVAIRAGEEYAASQLGRIRLATGIVAEWRQAVEREAIEVKIAARDFAPVGPDNGLPRDRQRCEEGRGHDAWNIGFTMITYAAAYSSPKYNSNE